MLPPRRPPWPFNSPSSTASRYIGQRTITIATTSPLTPTAATTTTTSTTPLTTTLVSALSASQGSTTSSSARVSPQPPPLTPPQYPAPPRPPSRNGKSITLYRYSTFLFSLDYPFYFHENRSRKDHTDLALIRLLFVPFLIPVQELYIADISYQHARILKILFLMAI